VNIDTFTQAEQITYSHSKIPTKQNETTLNIYLNPGKININIINSLYHTNDK